MKKHAIIPIFIPHLGCPCQCVFCNQQKITARTKAVSTDEVRETVERYLSTLADLDPSEIEIAFYGGSFTAIPIDAQTAYLEVANEYIDQGRVSSLHISTRPDCIDEEVLSNLKRYNVSTIELGVQSFSDEVLRLSKRGHDSDTARKAARLIKERGFKLGIQLMIGLPGDSLESCIYSARETVALSPELSRLYPTLVIDGTELYDMYEDGSYEALSKEEALLRTKEMYKILHKAGINIMRVGLKSTDIIGGSDLSAINGGTYHPAFRQLVEGEIAYEMLKEQLDALMEKLDGTGFAKTSNPDATGHTKTPNPDATSRTNTPKPKLKVDLFSNPQSFSNMIGNCGINKERLSAEYPNFDIKYRTDNNLARDIYIAELK
jgi:ELP3 component of the RNA polymerase II complex, consists of an N-terminal bioB/lipA-like domain and a C-terminal histone acetyltransferase domain (only bioB/lipA-like domain in thermotoga)